MNKNHMEEVAKLLGVELEEEFHIKGAPIEWIYELSDDGLIMYNEGQCHGTLPHLLTGLLTGKNEIVKLPWKPTNKGETYYMPAIDDESGYYTVDWLNDDSDKLRYHRGLVCRTKEEAIALAKEMLAVAQEEHNTRSEDN